MRKKRSKLIGVFAVLAAASAGFIYYQNSQSPEVGVKDGRFRPLSSKPNNISTQASEPEKRVDPLEFKATAKETSTALIIAIHSVGKATLEVEDEDYLHAVFTTPLMRFHDDAEFWLDVEEKLVHVRSASRAGYSDMGMNRRRYQKLAEIYKNL